MESGTKEFFESIFNCKRDFGNKSDCYKNKHIFQVKKFNFKIMIISIIIVILVENSSSFIKLNSDSKIMITINSKGEQKIINDKYNSSLSKVEINSTVQKDVKNSYELEGINFIIITLKEGIKSFDNMFANIKQITEIDLSGLNNNNITNLENMFLNCISLTSVNFGRFFFSSVLNMKSMFDGCTKLSNLNLENFETSYITSTERMFYNCQNLRTIDLSKFKTRLLKTMKHMFYLCTNLISIKFSPKIDTSQVTDLSYLFGYCNKLQSIDLSKFDTSSVETMEYMFYSCQNLISLDFSSFNTSNVTKMNHMFVYCEKLESLDLSNFETSLVTNMEYMFSNCKNLKSFNFEILNEEKKTSWIKFKCGFKSFVFFWNSDYDNCIESLTKTVVYNFNLFRVKNMQNMFSSCSSLESIDLSNLNISSVENMKYMFQNCENLKSINFQNINTSKVTSMEGLFSGCKNIQNIDFSLFQTDSLKSISKMFEKTNFIDFTKLKDFDTSMVEDISYMFNSVKEIISIDLSYLNIQSVTNMDYMFNDCSNLISFKFNKSNISNIKSMNGLFKGCISLESIDLSDMNASCLLSINHIFYGCQNLKIVNLTNFDTSKVTDISYMFQSCINLSSIDLNELNISSVTKMNNLFYHCHNLISININKLDTSKVIDMSFMFYSCSNLESIDLSHINTISVKNMANMFSSCNNLVILNISNFNTQNVKDMSFMFKDCFNLKNLVIQKFDTFSAVNINNMFHNCYNLTFVNILNLGCNFPVNMEYMFSGCNKLSSVILATPNISKVNNMKYMFSECKMIKSLDISKFDASNVVNMDYIFNECNSLISLNMSNFQTSKVTSMANLFNNCSNLNYIDINNFNTSLVEDMQNMFNGCEKIISLQLLSFDTLKVTNMKNMFNNCKNLESINLSSFNTYLVSNMLNMFAGCEKLLILDLRNFNFSSITEISGMFRNSKSLIYLNIGNKKINQQFEYKNIFNNNANDTQYCFEIQNYDIFSNYTFKTNCSHTCFHKDSNIIFEKRKCIEKCEYDEEFRYEYNKICIKECSNGIHSSYKDKFICEKDIKCPVFNINNTKCEEDTKEGYYLDKIDGIYRACYKNCKKCYGPGNNESNNCIECIDNMKFIDETFNQKNCFPKCDNYYYINSYQNYFCSSDSKCPLDYPKLVIEKGKCIENCKKDNKYKFEYNNNCYSSCPNGTIYPSNKKICFDIETISTDETKAEILAKEERISSFKEDLMNGDMDDILKNVTENKEDFIQEEKDMKLQLTTSENQKNSSNKNISTIDLGECENELKRIYKINDSLPLIILKFDYYTKDTLIPIVGYEIYHPTEKYKLNLTYCEEILIKLNIPVNIDEDKLFKYDPNSDYYTDDCSSYTSDDGTDIIINDRKKEFGSYNLSLCENNCQYMGYNTENKQSICDCGIKNEMEYISEIVNNQNKLSNQFDTNSSSSSNIISIKCTKTLFTKDGLKNNISSYVLLIIIFYFLLSIVFFIKCGYALILININNIINSKEKKSNKKNKRQKTFNKSSKKNKLDTSISIPPFRRLNVGSMYNKPIQKRYHRQPRSNLNILPGMQYKEIIIKTDDDKKNTKSINKISKSNTINIIRKSKEKIEKNETMNYNFNDYELNVMKYEDTLRYDKRTCSKYYFCLIKMKHPIFFGFCPFKDYNTIIIKSCIFFLSFAIYYAINFVFFSEDTIHKIYEDGGKYDIIYFIPQISISFAISHIITVLIKFIFLSERNLASINIQNTGNKAYDVAEKEKRSLVIKYTFFFILGIIFLGVFWLFLSAFGAVYQNTQIIVFENTLISFAISLVYPFFINIITCIFRICSLSSKNQGLGFFYFISKFFQLI